MGLLPGTRLGQYDIVATLGAGGMGEVYRARDTKLDRSVAIKILSDTFAHDPDRLARFEREAKMLAALSHPNIAIIHGFETFEGITALVMELVEGDTLADRVSRGPLLLDEALSIAKQVADALEAAHEQGIIHRDLKPANIKVRPDGVVKVLDFGLAKALGPEAAGSAPSLTNSPTLTRAIGVTGTGVLLGTASYMAPEQARGRAVDKRADIWAFGCVLYEMLTGEAPFGGDDASQILARVIEREPRWDGLPKSLPVTVRTLLRRCLQKDPKQRIRDIGDARLMLAGAFDVLLSSNAPANPLTGRRLLQHPLTAAGVAFAIGALIVFAAQSFKPAATPAPVRLSIAPPGGETFGGANSDSNLAISSDGKRVVFVTEAAPQRLYVRALDQLEAQRLVAAESPREPFFSPDGNWVGFFDGAANTLKKIATNGGPAVTVCDVVGGVGATGGGPRGGSWAPDNTIVFATNDSKTGLLRVPASGGQAEVLTTPNVQNGEADHFWPEVLPGGHGILFTIVTSGGSPNATARDIQNARIAVLDLRTGAQKVLVTGGSYAHYVPTGHIVYGFNGMLRAIAFDLERLEVRGDPVTVLQQVITKGTGAASFAIADDGTLVYQSAGVDTDSRTMVWVDRQGHEETIAAPPRAYAYPRISPDGTKVALESRDQDLDVWVWDFARARLTRLTVDPAPDVMPVWTPDGKRLVYGSEKVGASRLVWQLSDGSGVAETLSQSGTAQFPDAFSPDGKNLIVADRNAGQTNLSIVNMDGAHSTRPFIATAFTEQSADISPDGRWVAYQSNESGAFEIYVRPFPDVSGGRWPVSSGGGLGPVWARSGRELFYFALPGRMMVVPIRPGETFAAENPQVVFEGQYAPPLTNRNYDVSPDAQHFLMLKPTTSDSERNAPSQLVVVQHWFTELDEQLHRK